MRTGLERPIHEWNIGGDDNVALPCTFRDPIVGRVRPAVDHDPSDSPLRWHVHPAVGNDKDRHPIDRRDALDLVLDRASVGVDV